MKEGIKMRKSINKTMMVILTLISSISILAMATKAEALEPRLLWEKVFSDSITGLYIAKDTGNVLVHTSKEIWYFDYLGKSLWKKGDKENWGWIGGAGVSDDGEHIVFQTAPATEKATEVTTFYTHYLNKEGKEIWNSKTIDGIAGFSPNGEFIVTGDASSSTEMSIYNNKGVFLWKAKVGAVWDVKFDPTSNFFLVNEGGDGTLYSRKGEKIAKFKASMNPQLSKNAEYILASSIELPIKEEIYLYQKSGELLEIVKGIIGCISQEGNLLAIADKKQIQLITRRDKKIIWKRKIHNVDSCSISQDNGSIFVLSNFKKEKYNYMYLLDINKKKSKTLKIRELEKVKVTSDNKYFVIQQGKNKLKMFSNY